MKKLLVIPAALLLVALLIFVLIGDGDDRPPAGPVKAAATTERPEPTTLEEKPHRGLATVHCALEVNGARCRTVGRGTPLYVKCIVTNPLVDEALDIAGIRHRTPSFTTEIQEPFSPAMALIAPAAERVPAGGTAVLTWVLQEAPPPGRYDVALTPPENLAALPGVDRVRVKAAQLEITPDPSPESEVAWHRRQIMAARGENEMIIAETRTALERSPDDLALRRELVDALERTGSYAAAREELLELGFRAQARQQAGDEEAPVHLPAWILTRDRLLRERAAR